MPVDVQLQETTCHSCEERPIRPEGEYVSRLEFWTDQRMYCAPCARDCEAGRWDTDPEETE